MKRDSVVQSTYTYDLNGNRENNGAVYDDQDRLTATASATYVYTDNGELLTKTQGAQITQYKYDVLGNLLSVELPDGNLIEYIIDASNRRIGKKYGAPGATVLQKAWLYKDGLNPVAELDGAGNVVARFVYASRGNIPDYVIKGGVTYRIISDHLGSPRLVINSADGTVVEAIEYDDWGNVLSDTNPGFLPFAFAGGLYDADTKLIRFGARDYDPETGRWTAKDPIRFDGDGPNLYGYVLNDPVDFTDSKGLKKGDKWFGYKDREFQRWFHSKKTPGQPDIDTEEKMRKKYDEWKKKGKPKSDNKGKHRKKNKGKSKGRGGAALGVCLLVLDLIFDEAEARAGQLLEESLTHQRALEGPARGPVKR